MVGGVGTWKFIIAVPLLLNMLKIPKDELFLGSSL